VVLLFAIVFLTAMVLNPIVVWLRKHHVPRLASVILLMLALVTVTGTIILFAIPPLARQSQELVQSAPKGSRSSGSSRGKELTLTLR
jgi:predicted PurR-regulated permease PerM